VNDLFIVPSASAPIAEGILSRCLVEAETPRDFREIAEIAQKCAEWATGVQAAA